MTYSVAIRLGWNWVGRRSRLGVERLRISGLGSRFTVVGSSLALSLPLCFDLLKMAFMVLESELEGKERS